MRTDWPNSAEVAVSLTFDVDAESGWLGEDPAYAGRLSTLSEGRFGVTRGLPRILEILDRHEIKGTFYVPGDTAERHTAAIARVVEARPRDRPPRLPAQAQRRDLAAEQREEIEPGHRGAPGAAGRHAAGLPEPELGAHARDARAAQALRLHLRQQPDGRRSPVRLRRPARAARALEPGRLAAPALEARPRRRVHRPGGTSSTRGCGEFESALRDHRHVTYTMHPEVIGRGYRAQLLDDLITAMTANGKGVVRPPRGCGSLRSGMTFPIHRSRRAHALRAR